MRASGASARMAAVSSSSNRVLPALGGETMSPRVPRPMGANRSMIRIEGLPPLPRWKRRSGLMAGRSANGVRPRYTSGLRPQMDSTSTSRGPCFAVSLAPRTTAPVVRPNWFSVCCDTNTSARSG